MLIHLVGDMHCPMHTGRLSDIGGNQRPVLMFGRKTNLHSAWDSAILEAGHKWSYTEWQEQIDRLTAPKGRKYPTITWTNTRPSSSSSSSGAVTGWHAC